VSLRSSVPARRPRRSQRRRAATGGTRQCDGQVASARVAQSARAGGGAAPVARRARARRVAGRSSCRGRRGAHVGGTRHGRGARKRILGNWINKRRANELSRPHDAPSARIVPLNVKALRRRTVLTCRSLATTRSPRTRISARALRGLPRRVARRVQPSPPVCRYPIVFLLCHRAPTPLIACT
jgi:hypothetical protein